jgi:hypothetical protein
MKKVRSQTKMKGGKDEEDENNMRLYIESFVASCRSQTDKLSGSLTRYGSLLVWSSAVGQTWLGLGHRTTKYNWIVSVQLPLALPGPCILLSKEHQKFITKGHYILATISLKFRAQITKL